MFLEILAVMNHIILNYLPPGRIFSPSPAFSILKSFMEQHKYKVSVKYWNIEIEEITREVLLNPILNDDETLNQLIPFLCEIAVEKGDVLCQNKIRAYIQTVAPEHNSLDTFVSDTALKLHDYFHNQLPKIVGKEVILFGFSAKFNQWISAIVLARILKKISPNIKTIIGGFGDKEGALSVMKISKDFDYAVWGEGEYILLDICNQINAENDFSNIPRLIYREDNKLVISKKNSGRYLDLNSEIMPDYSDYFFPKKDSHILPEDILIPIEGSRSCHWKKCKFCYLNQGYKYRKKSANRLFNEIVYFNQKYPNVDFFFTDNDLVSNSMTEFEELLNKIIEYNKGNENCLKMYTVEVIPSGFSNEMIKKMALAGVKQVQIGYESTSDGLLKKINKKSSFSDNILFLKFAKKYGIEISGMNIIKNIPDETDEDILEGIDNIRYMRFYLDNKLFKHHVAPLHINSQSRYYKELNENQINNWSENFFYDYMPEEFWVETNKYDLMSFCTSVTKNLWSLFDKIDLHYSNIEYSYRLLRNGNVFYEEYCCGRLINNIEFYEPQYWELLMTTNNKVCSLQEINVALIEKGYEFTQNEIIEIIQNLKGEYLLYANKDCSAVVSIIDTDKII